MRSLLAAAAAASLALIAAAPAAAAGPACDRYASDAGSDPFGAGTQASPWRTAGKVVGALAPGQVGCLTGTFTEDVAFNSGGITLASASSATPATIKGTVYVNHGANGVTLLGLKLDQTPSSGPGLRIEADDTALVGNEIFNDTLSCVFVGPEVGLSAARTRIEGNRLHDCNGGPGFAIQLDFATDTVMADNIITASPGNAIDLFPSPQGTTIRNNSIDGADVGVKFYGDASTQARQTTVADNIITGSSGTAAVAAEWTAPGSVTPSNVVNDNCVVKPIFASSAYTTSGNQTVTTGTNPVCAGKGPQPSATTGAATDLTQTTATVHGEINPHWQAATWFFEWGPTAALGKSTTSAAIDPFSTPQPAAGTLTSLQAGTTYYFRLVATTAAGTRREGATQSFTTVAAPAPPPPSDADADGIPDAQDRCATTARGTVDADADGCPDDSDGDGIADAADKCVSQARGTVDANADGCPDDSDGDGIFDALDKCPAIARGTRDSDADGCPNKPPAVSVGSLAEERDIFADGSVRFTKISVVVRTKGATVRIRCKRGCRVKAKLKVRKSGPVRLKQLVGHRLRRGSVFDVVVTRAGATGLDLRVTIARGGAVSVRRLCVPLGASKPGKC